MTTETNSTTTETTPPMRRNDTKVYKCCTGCQTVQDCQSIKSCLNQALNMTIGSQPELTSEQLKDLRTVFNISEAEKEAARLTKEYDEMVERLKPTKEFHINTSMLSCLAAVYSLGLFDVVWNSSYKSFVVTYVWVNVFLGVLIWSGQLRLGVDVVGPSYQGLFVHSALFSLFGFGYKCLGDSVLAHNIWPTVAMFVLSIGFSTGWRMFQAT